MTAATITAKTAATTRWDVAVVGAGPAGATAAYLAAKQFAKVILIDQADFPRGKVCGCCLNNAALATLHSIGLGGLVPSCRAVPIGHVQLGASGRTVDLVSSRGVSLSRERFDVALIESAIASGAEFLPSTRVKMGPITDDARTLVAESVEIEAKIVICADGLNGRLAAAAEGFVVPATTDSRIGAGVVLDANASDDYPRGTIFMATAPGGYVGLVRLEDDRIDVAAAFDAEFVRTQGSLGNAASKILAVAGFPNIDTLEHASWRGTPSLTRTPPAIVGTRWYSIGDAAGYVEPFTGEGMAWALASAATLVPMLANGWDDTHLRTWPKRHSQMIRTRQSTCRAVSMALRRPTFVAGVVRLLRIAPWLSWPVVRRLDRLPTRRMVE